MADLFSFDATQQYFMKGLNHTLTLDPPESGHEYFKSLVSAKQTQFSKPSEIAEIKSILDLTFRSFLVERLDIWTKKGNEVQVSEVERLVELALWSAHHEVVDPSLVLSLFEDLFDSQTIDKCQSLFSILESRAPSLAHDMFVQERTTARSVLLRVCTTLLKRLSKTNNAEFCGRILIFLAYVFPLSDRSGLNVKSECNIANVTVTEESNTTTQENGEPSEQPAEKMQVDGKAEETQNQDDNAEPIDFGFYRTFWSLHTYFQNFQIIFLHPDKWPTFVRSVELVLAAFAGNSNLEDVVQPQNHYFTKYLTSSNLMKLQLKDSSFRRHILVQLLILFQAFNTPVLKQSTQILKDKQKQVILELTEKVKELLQGTQPKGPQFTRTVLDILQRENNWILWKRENCKGFERSSTATQTAGPKKAAANAIGGKVKKIQMGNAELSRLWNLSTDNHEVLVQTSNTPSLDDFLKPILEDKPTLLKDDKIYAWKAMRLIARTRFRYLSELSEKKLSNMDDLAAIIEKDKKGNTTHSENGNGSGLLGSGDVTKRALGVSADFDVTMDDKDHDNEKEKEKDKEKEKKEKREKEREKEKEKEKVKERIKEEEESEGLKPVKSERLEEHEKEREKEKEKEKVNSCCTSVPVFVCS